MLLSLVDFDFYKKKPVPDEIVKGTGVKSCGATLIGRKSAHSCIQSYASFVNEGSSPAHLLFSVCPQEPIPSSNCCCDSTIHSSLETASGKGTYTLSAVSAFQKLYHVRRTFVNTKFEKCSFFSVYYSSSPYLRIYSFFMMVANVT